MLYMYLTFSLNILMIIVYAVKEIVRDTVLYTSQIERSCSPSSNLQSEIYV